MRVLGSGFRVLEFRRLGLDEGSGFRDLGFRVWV